MAQIQQGGPDEKEKTTALKGTYLICFFRIFSLCLMKVQEYVGDLTFMSILK